MLSSVFGDLIALRIYNSASHRKDEFRSIDGNTVKMYVCGITPYDTTHIGHAFTYVSFDVLVRYLRFCGFRVVYTQNVTDIDDDILRKAREGRRNWRELGTFWTKIYINDMKKLNVPVPTHYVKATESIDAIKKMVSGLLRKGFAYKSGGNVYFDVKKFPRYGRLSRFSANQMKLLLKERGGDPNDPSKRNPLDFILWQKWKNGEPFWETEWGRGRPGWHIECSSMINQYLGDRIDIHGGGRDLIFPHHESEIAQSESYTGKRPFARYFIHTAMVMNAGEKMSKSLGNLVMVSDLLKKHSPNAIRWMLLSHHYRDVWEYDAGELDSAEANLKKIERLLSSAKRSGNVDKDAVREFRQMMDDDLNTPASLHLLRHLSACKDPYTVRYIMSVLGFFT